jgi:hypothetical protein
MIVWDSSLEAALTGLTLRHWKRLLDKSGKNRHNLTPYQNGSVAQLDRAADF